MKHSDSNLSAYKTFMPLSQVPHLGMPLPYGEDINKGNLREERILRGHHHRLRKFGWKPMFEVIPHVTSLASGRASMPKGLCIAGVDAIHQVMVAIQLDQAPLLHGRPLHCRLQVAHPPQVNPTDPSELS